MNKLDLIKNVATETGYTQKDITTVINSMLEIIKNQVKSGETVQISDFGKFSSTERAARTARNPVTGDPVEVAASRAFKFSPSASVKKMMKE